MDAVSPTSKSSPGTQEDHAEHRGTRERKTSRDSHDHAIHALGRRKGLRKRTLSPNTASPRAGQASFNMEGPTDPQREGTTLVVSGRSVPHIVRVHCDDSSPNTAKSSASTPTNPRGRRSTQGVRPAPPRCDELRSRRRRSSGRRPTTSIQKETRDNCNAFIRVCVAPLSSSLRTLCSRSAFLCLNPLFLRNYSRATLQAHENYTFAPF